MEWIQVITIIGSIFVPMFWFFTRIDNDVKSGNDKLDSWIRHSMAISAEQNKRTDKLYQMFIDLLNVKKP